MNSIRPFSESRSRRIRSSERPFGPPRHKAEHRPQLALAVACIRASRSGRPPDRRAGPAPSRSRARWPRRASRRRSRSSPVHLRGRDVLVAADAHLVPGALDPVVGLPHGPHRAPVEGELGGLHDRFVAQLQRVQAVPGVDRAAPPRSPPSPPGSSRARGPRPARARSRRARPPGRRSGRRRPARPRPPRGRRPRPCRSGDQTTLFSRRSAK